MATHVTSISECMTPLQNLEEDSISNVNVRDAKYRYTFMERQIKFLITFKIEKAKIYDADQFLCNKTGSKLYSNVASIVY